MNIEAIFSAFPGPKVQAKLASSVVQETDFLGAVWGSDAGAKIVDPVAIWPKAIIKLPDRRKPGPTCPGF